MIPDHLKAQVAQLPRSTGVYLFKDKEDNLLYVGKSKELRTRVSSYFRGDLRDKDLRLQRMIHDVRSIEHLRSSSELLALLLEDSLIKHGDPVYNLRQNKYRRYVYLKFTNDPFPRLESIPQSQTAEGPLYGPYPDEYFLPRLESLLGRHYGLRNCHDKNPTQVCMQADLGLCLAPCVNQDAVDEYAQTVDRVHGLLVGDDASLLEVIKSAMALAVKEEEFETAARCRDELQFAGSMIERQRFTRDFTNKSLTLDDEQGFTCKFTCGDLVEILPASDLLDGDRTLLNEDPIDDDRFLLDRAYILSRWLSRHNLDHHFS